MLEVVKRFDIPVIRTHLKTLLSLRNLSEYQKAIKLDVIKESRNVIKKHPEEAALIITAYYLKFGNFGGGLPDNKPFEMTIVEEVNREEVPSF